MPSKESRAERFRLQAADMRELAARSNNPSFKTEYLRVAREYEKLTAEVEKLDDTKH